jgi:photosystem II stability/assembly factor-like uncharacterized protein
VVAKDTKYLANYINPDNIRLDLDPYNNSHISIDFPDIRILHSSHDSKYNYLYMSEDSSDKFKSSNKWIPEQKKWDYYGSFGGMGEFELRKDLCRLALSKDVDQKVEILKRLSHYPRYNQTTANEIVPLYITDPNLREQIINLYTPVKKRNPPDTTLRSELPSSLKSKWIQTNGPFGGLFGFLQSITNRSGIKYLFAGSSDNELYRSSDDGKNWISFTIGSANNHIKTFFVNNYHLFVGSIDGLFRSSDDGLSWDTLTTGFAIEEKPRINCFTSNSKFIFAGADTKGLFRSSDDGNSWVKVNPAIIQQQVWALCTKDSLLFAGTTVGIYVSSDNGDNWLPANNGLPTNLLYPNGKIRLHVICIEYLNGKLFAGLEQAGLFVSTDNGNSWKAIRTDLYRYETIFGIKGDSENLFLNYNRGVLLSKDSGSTWSPFNTEPIIHCRISIVDHSSIYACSSYGIFLSTDFGKNWINCNNGISKTVVNKFAVKGNTLFAATYYNGLFKSTNNGTTWDFISPKQLNDAIEDIAVNENYLVVLTMQGIFLSSDEGETWTLKFEKKDSHALFVKGNLFIAETNHGICRSTDNGNNWTTVGHNSALSKFTECGGFIFAKCIDKLFRSTDDGLTWDTAKVPVKHFDLESMIDDGKNLYAVISSDGSIFKSTNKGADWTIIKNEQDFYAQALLASHNYLFAADREEYGIYISKNKAGNWIPFNYGLGNLHVNTFIVKDNILFAGTSAGVWMHPLNK